MGSHNTQSSSVLEYPQTDILLYPARFYSPGCCLRCYIIASVDKPLMRCGQCQLVAYCSKNCQKMDWPGHKKFCKTISTLPDELTFKNMSESSLYLFSQKLIDNCKKLLKRNLQSFEKDILLYPKICMICMESKSSLLSSCSGCHCVFYCTDKHDIDKEHLDKWCSQYKINLQCNSFEMIHGIQDLPFPFDVDDTYLPLTGNLESVVKSQITPTDGSSIDEEVQIIIYERLSYSLSLLYALQKVGVGINSTAVNEVTNLRIHIIGATSLVEMLGIIRWEYIIHRLPNIKKLHVVFIGPELYKGINMEEEEITDKHGLDDSGMTRCPDCLKNNRLVVYEMANMTYHEFSESMRYTRPDFMIAFNPCFKIFNGEMPGPWNTTLDYILDNYETPFAFTSYSKSDSKDDFEVINEVSNNYSVMFETEKNPFSSLRPVRDPTKKDTCPLYYSNQYISCIKGNKS